MNIGNDRVQSQVSNTPTPPTRNAGAHHCLDSHRAGVATCAIIREALAAGLVEIEGLEQFAGYSDGKRRANEAPHLDRARRSDLDVVSGPDGSPS
jgi:hypothetical protein